MATSPRASNLQQYLQEEFAKRKQKNPKYSLRSFSRDLEMDATALSRVLAGSRQVGPTTAKKILAQLRISPATRETLLRSLIAPDDHSVLLDHDYVELTSEQLEQMDHWIYSAILELARSKGLTLESAALARFFGISIPDAETRIKDLITLGLLKKTEKGLRTIHQRSTAAFKKDSLALRKIHTGYIHLAVESLTHPVPQARDISGITVLASKEKLEEASKRIKEFRRSLAHFLGTDRGTELYRLNIQLFPLKKPTPPRE